MAKKKGFYENIRLHVQRKGRGVKLSVYLPEGNSSNLFSEIKSSIRKEPARRPQRSSSPENSPIK